MTPRSGTNGDPADLVPFDYAIVRAVPHVHLGTFIPVGVVVHARTAEFLGMRALHDPALLAARVPGVDAELLASYLRSLVAVSAGDASAGPVALDSTSERFHWLTAPRSDVLQTSPVHGGLCADPEIALDRLFNQYVLDGSQG